MDVQNHIRQHGLTLIELTIVIFTISVFVGIAVSSIGSSSKASAISQVELFVNDIRHAQSIAINWGCEIEVRISASNYQLFSKTDLTASGKALCGNGTAIAEFPGHAAPFSNDLIHDLAFTTTGSIYFDSFGRPISAVGALLGATSNFDLSQEATSWRVSISPISGFTTYQEL